MKGSEFKKKLIELGITTADMVRESGLSDTTLSNIFNGETVRPTTWSKALNAFKRLESEQLRTESVKFSGGRKKAAVS